MGTRLSDFTTVSNTLFSSPGVRLIGLNVSALEGQKYGAAPLTADAKRGLEALSFALGHYKTPPSYRERVESEIRTWFSYAKQITIHPEEPPSQAQVIAAVNRTIGPEAIVVASSGGIPAQLHKLWKVMKPHTYQVCATPCLGYEISAGLGAKLAYPNKEVYVLLEDASYLSNHSALYSSIRLGVKLNIVLLRHLESCIDFAANAASYGCQAVQVGTIAGLVDVLSATKQIKESCVTIIETDPTLSTPSNARITGGEHG